MDPDRILSGIAKWIHIDYRIAETCYSSQREFSLSLNYMWMDCTKESSEWKLSGCLSGIFWVGSKRALWVDVWVNSKRVLWMLSGCLGGIFWVDINVFLKLSKRIFKKKRKTDSETSWNDGNPWKLKNEISIWKKFRPTWFRFPASVRKFRINFFNKRETCWAQK